MSSVLVSCCMESMTREAAEEAIEEELRPLVDKPLLERSGSAIGALDLRPYLDRVFDARTGL